MTQHKKRHGINYNRRNENCQKKKCNETKILERQKKTGKGNIQVGALCDQGKKTHNKMQLNKGETGQ